MPVSPEADLDLLVAALVRHAESWWAAQVEAREGRDEGIATPTVDEEVRADD